MGKIRILAVEDEPIHQEKIYIVLEELGYELIGIVDNVKDALQMMFATKPDIVLMDIALEGEKDGIEIAAKINQTIPTPIIFTTSFRDKQTINKAMQTNPYAYLIKPIQEENLQAAIELALFKFAKDRAQQEFDEAPFQQWSKDILVKDSFFTKQAGKLIKVKFGQVIWIEVLKNKYCQIKTVDNEITLRATLKELSKKLPPQIFVQVHRAYIVNAHFIESMDEAEGTVQVKGVSLPMGRIHKEAVLKRLNLI